MRIIKNLEQGTDAWKKWRQSGLGASDSSVVVNMNPYRTKLELFNDKTDRSFGVETNSAMQAGKDAEEPIRREYNRMIGKEFIPVCAEHKDYNYILCSFDGWCEKDNSIIEIKFSQYPKMSNCIRKKNVEHFKEVYGYIYCQVMHQMMVSDAKECSVVTISPDGELLWITIPRDDEFIEQLLMPALVVFWNEHIIADVKPGLGKGDVLYIDSPEAIAKATEYLTLAATIKDLQAKEKALKKEIADFGDDGNFVISNVLKGTRIEKIGSIDNARLYKDKGITDKELEAYRKPQGIGYWKYSEVK